MSEAKSTAKHIYGGGCHCGAVRYSVSTGANPPVISCNCSICSKKGSLLSFVPADDFKLLAGKDAVSDYQFNTKNRSEEHTSELQSLMRISYAVFCLKKKTIIIEDKYTTKQT